MRGSLLSSLLALCACKVQISDAPGGSIPADGNTTARDAPPDTPEIKLGPWQLATQVRGASTTAVEDDVTLSSNALEMFFAINTANGKDLYYLTRVSTLDPWSAPMPMPFNDATESDETPRLSADDRTLYFASGRGGNTLDIYSTTRPMAGSTAWGTPQPVVAVNTTTQSEKWFMPCGAGRYVMVQTNTQGDNDLVEGVLGVAPIPLDALNSGASETGTFVSADCLTLYFASTRTSPTRIFRAERPAIGAPWGTPVPITDFSLIGGNQEDPWLSLDGRTFAFASDAVGNKDVYVSTR